MAKFRSKTTQDSRYGLFFSLTFQRLLGAIVSLFFVFGISTNSFGELSTGNFSSLYDESTLKYWQEKYPKNAEYNFYNVLIKALSSEERKSLGKVELRFPLFQDNNPLGFYSDSKNRIIFLPIMSIKFLDDLSIANAWLSRNGFTTTSLYYYFSMMKYNGPERFPGGRYPPPLKALHIPDDAYQTDPWVDRVSQNLLKSAFLFIMANELGHIYYHHDPNLNSQEIDRKADAFVIEIFRRIGVPPAGLIVYFQAATSLSKNSGDFASKSAWKQFLHTDNHHFTAERLYAIAAMIRERPNDFVRTEPNYQASLKLVENIANQINNIARTQEDIGFQKAISQVGKNLDLSLLKPQRAESQPTLVGKVVGEANDPKAYVRIEIYGPENKTIFTNSNGEFSANLSAGDYKINIIEMNKRQTFNYKVSRNNINERIFKLNW